MSARKISPLLSVASVVMVRPSAMVPGGVEHITRGGRQLLHGVDTGLQGGNGNAAIGIRYPVEVVTAILHLGDAECGPGQIVAGVGVILDHRQRRLGSIGKDKLSVLASVQLDNTSAVVNEVALRGLGLLDGIGAGVQLGQVDLAIGIGHELLGVGAKVSLSTFTRCIPGFMELKKMRVAFWA